MKFTHQQVEVSSGKVHVVSAGASATRTLGFLHGWPQDWSAFQSVMRLAAPSSNVFAMDLPGIGRSHFSKPPSRKRDIAAAVHDVVRKLGLEEITIVGHDVGGQVVYAYLRQYAREIRSAVILDVVIPGIDPWDEVLRNPHIWHFAFHNVAELPETLVFGKQAEYFDFFFNAIAASSTAIDREARKRYVEAYRTESALKTGFEWYRAFEQDASDNAADKGKGLDTPVLLIRGDHESGKIATYAEGLRRAGLVNLSSKQIAGTGHFAPEEQPEGVWRAIASFISA